MMMNEKSELPHALFAFRECSQGLLRITNNSALSRIE